jgi:hypothetical protein
MLTFREMFQVEEYLLLLIVNHSTFPPHQKTLWATGNYLTPTLDILLLIRRYVQALAEMMFPPLTLISALCSLNASVFLSASGSRGMHRTLSKSSGRPESRTFSS